MRRGLARPAVLSAALLTVLGQVQAAAPTTQVPPKTLCAVQPPYGQWGTLAKFIGGVNSDPYSLAMSPEQRASWSEYSRIAGAEWSNLQRHYLDHIAAWRARYLSGVQESPLAFYPFSGPDSANMLAFFPEARQYILVGLEPVGCVPAGIQDYNAAYFTELRHSLEPVVAMGFFRTNDMQREFSNGNVNGVLPLILFLLARGGYAVENVTSIVINSAGQVAPWSPNPPAGLKTEAWGAEIQFRDSRHGLRTLQYFSMNLQDSRLRGRPGTLKYVESLPEMATLIKSASYLMHKEYFSRIRGAILAKSRVVVEDDSGIPLHFFDPASWDVRLYGNYSEPIALFKTWHQEDLKAAFASQSGVQPLDFAMGYRKPNQSNLLLALKRGN